MKISPRSCRLKIAYDVATPARSATSAPLARDGNRAVPRLPAREDVVHDAGALGVGHELRAEADQPARRNPELEPHAAAAVVHHLRHHALALADLRDDDALMILRHVDDQLFDRLDHLAVDRLGDDVGTRDLQLEAFAAHHLDQNRQLQLAAADDLHLLGRVGRLEADRDVAEQLACRADPSAGAT